MREVNHVGPEGKSVKTMIFRWLQIAVYAAVALFHPASANAATNEFMLGEVRVDPAARSISFPAQVNQRIGAIEYLLVHETGKVHESIFKTSVGAQQIHAAALLFSEKATNGAPKLKVSTIEIFWKQDEKEKRLNAAELILDKKNHRPLGNTKWAYRGSRLIGGVFLAHRDGSIVAIMEDRDALIDQDTPDAADDENWEPVSARVPPLGTPLTVTVSFAR
jgi:hypothetical protein